MSAVDAVEAEVRELVRRRGLDPITDRSAMRRLVDEVVSRYDERALTSALAPLPDSRRSATRDDHPRPTPETNAAHHTAKINTRINGYSRIQVRLGWLGFRPVGTSGSGVRMVSPRVW